MSHCSEPSENRRLNEADFLRLFREQCPKPERREFPAGRLDATDDGAFKMGVTVIKVKIVMAFDRPMDWVGLTPVEASDLADTLNARALEARGIT